MGSINRLKISILIHKHFFFKKNTDLTISMKTVMFRKKFSLKKLYVSIVTGQNILYLVHTTHNVLGNIIFQYSS